MLQLTQQSDILIALEPVDFRKQIDGLIILCKNLLKLDANNGQFFVFINRASTMVRVLCYDGNGYWLATKRLSRGRFKDWPKEPAAVKCSIKAAQLNTLLKGLTQNHLPKPTTQ